jgi:DNA-binding NtrC family response regulator
MARILVIDDDRPMRTMLGLMLSRAGHEVGLYANGRLAMASIWAGARFPETVCCATDRIDGGRAWTGRMGWNLV